MAGRRPRETAPGDPLRPGGTGNAAPGSMGGHKFGQGNQWARGNTGNFKHGMQSERAISVRAEAIITAMLGDEKCPDYLRSAAFIPSVMAWGRAEAMASLAWEWCESMGMEMFVPGEGHGKSPADVWRTLHAHARGVRNDIGLSPVSYAKIARDLGIAQSATEDRLNAAAKEGRAITAKRMGVVQATADASDDGQP